MIRWYLKWESEIAHKKFKLFDSIHRTWINVLRNSDSVRNIPGEVEAYVREQ